MFRAILFAVLLTCSAARADDLTNLVDLYAAWRGGMAFEHLQSVHLRGSLDTAGLQGTEEIWADRNGRQRLDVDLGVLKQTQVVAPVQSWDIAPSGQVETLSQSDGRSITRDQALQFPDVLRGRGAKATLRISQGRPAA
jgi:hypothetical protein